MTAFGLHNDAARATFDRQIGKADEILTELRAVVLAKPLEDPEAGQHALPKGQNRASAFLFYAADRT